MQTCCLVNDTHSKLNHTTVSEIISAKTLTELTTLVRHCTDHGKSLAICGGRHSMGGQQFSRNNILLNMNHLNRIINFDTKEGLIEIEGGIRWTQLITYLQTAQENVPYTQRWSIAQKQTGANELSLGGAIASNVHGRGLNMRPIIDNVVSFKLVNSRGEVVTCSRQENSELFRLVAGGYGLFGIVYSLVLKLVPTKLLRRNVELIDVKDLVVKLNEKISEGCTYGDFQFAIDAESSDFLSSGILSTYKAISDTEIERSAQYAGDKKILSENQWQKLIYLAHTNKSLAYEEYANHYLATNGQLYWSDTFQLATYKDDYHHRIDEEVFDGHAGSEMITELYVPREDLAEFMACAAQVLRINNADVIYGTVRLIKQDSESFLAWAKADYACIVLNLHSLHDSIALKHLEKTLQDLIDLAIKFKGNYFLTYHRYARPDQVLTCYPQLPEFLRHKLKYDPNELFSSNWYLSYRACS